MSKKKEEDKRSGMPIVGVVGVVGTGQRRFAELLNALHRAQKDVDFGFLNDQFGTGGWHVSDGEIRDLLSEIVSSEDDVDELISRAGEDEAVMNDLIEALGVAVPVREMGADAAVGDNVRKISPAHYSDYVAFVEKRADYYLRVLGAILEEHADADEKARVQAVKRRLGPVYDAEIMSMLDELGHTDDVDLGRKLISVISEVSPDLFSKLQDRYCQTAI